MAAQRGRLVTGLADFAGSPKFKITAHGFEQKMGLATRDRSGRGTGNWGDSRPVSASGSLIVRGKVRNDGYPLPDQWKGQTGTVEVQYHSGGTTGATAKETLSVRVDAADVKLVSKNDEDWWDITLACTILDNPTLSGFGGTQAVATDPEKSNQELYSGLSKTYDPNNLHDNGTVTFDVWPLGDTDVAERQALIDIVAIVAAASRFPGAKVKTASLLAGRDHEGGVISVTLSLTDTAEDVINPATATTADPNDLTSQASAAAINGTPSGPGGDYVARETTTRELHDGATLTTVVYGLRDTKEDVEFPGTQRTADAASLFNADQITLVRPTGTTPATPASSLNGVVLRHVNREQINRLQWRHTFTYGHRTTKQDIEFEGSPRENDPSNLTDSESVTQETDTEAPPATPTPNNASLKLRRIRSVRLTDSGRWVHRFDFARRNAEDDVEMDGTARTVDPLELADVREATVVQSNTAASWPAETTLSQYDYTWKQIHDTRYAVTYRWRWATTEKEKEATHTRSTRDLGGLYVGNSAMTADVWTAGAEPADPANPPVDGLKLVEKYDVPLTFSQAGAVVKSLRVYLWGTGNAVDRLEFNYEKAIYDANGLASALVYATVWPTANVDPGGPETPANEPADPGSTVPFRTQTLKRKLLHDLPITTAGKTTAGAVTFRKYLRVWYYEPTDTADEVELPRSPARRGAIEPAEIAVASVIDSTDPDWSDGSASGISAAVHARLATGSAADKTFDHVDVLKLSDTRAVKKIVTVPDFRIVRTSSRAGKAEVKAWLEGSAVMVWLAQKAKRGSNQYWIYVEGRSIPRMVTDFEIHRRVRASTVEQLYGYAGTSNNAPFMGYPRWTVTFAGLDISYDRLTGTPRIYDLRYKFRFDSAGQFTDTGVRQGWSFSTADLSGVSTPSIQTALRMGWTQATILTPNDYSIFTDADKESLLFT